MNRLFSLIITGIGISLATIPGTSQAASNEWQSVQIAMAPVSGQLIQVSTTCDKGTAVFMVTNIGESLQFAYSFSIVRVNSNSVVSKRRLRLVAGQNATLRVKNANKIPSEFALRINAKDYDRDGQIHALVRCHA